MSEFQVNQPEICSICGEEKEPEELSELDGQRACLDCIARANISKNVPLEQLAAATGRNAHRKAASKSSLFPLIVTLLILGILVAGGFYLWRTHHRKQTLEASIASLKAEGDAFARVGKFDEALARYEAIVKQLQGKPLESPQLVELYHQAEKSAAGPYLRIAQPKLEKIEALLLAGRDEEARSQFRELAAFINAHTIQPELSMRQRIDHVTDQLKVPRIAKANWRRESPSVAIFPHPTTWNTQSPRTQPTIEPIPTPQVADSSPKPAPQPQSQPQPTAVTPTPAVVTRKSPQIVSVPDPDSQAKALDQIRARFADKYAQRDAPARRALAHLLLITAQESPADLPTRFVLLRESRDIAIHAGEPRIALVAVDEMANSFLIDDVAMRLSTLAESAQNAFGPDGNELIAGAGLALADRMAKERHFDEAYRCAVIANTAAQQTRDQTLILQTAAKLKQLKR
jgi:hypothetical protein